MDVSWLFLWHGSLGCWRPKPEQRAQFELSPSGIHWEALDEDISIDGLLAGHGDLTHGRLVAPL